MFDPHGQVARRRRTKNTKKIFKNLDIISTKNGYDLVLLHTPNCLEHRSIASIFRIIGNENLPRDTIGKRLEVLKFILQNEPKFDNVEKWYIVNRLQNIQFHRSICELLDQYNAKYITVPLDRQAVINAKDRLDKIRCAIEINKARNLAIEHGRWNSQYVVVLDGDCCFNKEGWDEVVSKMAMAHQYISIPHVRSNIETFEHNVDRSEFSEPMVAFRHDADLRFDENIPFGQGDKLHLLFDLGHDQTPGSGHCKISGNKTISAGYVLHLSTGDENIENNTLARIDTRNESLDKLLKKITHEECKEEIFSPVSPWAFSWAVGVTTAARQAETLRGTVNDLVAAGWDQITIFAEPQSFMPNFGKEGVSYKVNVEVLGAWRNWRESFMSLVANNPTADFYAVVQDDVTTWCDLRKFFDEKVLPAQRAVYSPYTAGWYGGDNKHPAGSLVLPDCGWFHDSITQQLGALFTIIPGELAKDLVTWLPAEVPNNNEIDVRLAEILQKHTVPFYRHSPSLADHTGTVSTLGYDEGGFNRRARDFVGVRGEL